MNKVVYLSTECGMSGLVLNCVVLLCLTSVATFYFASFSLFFLLLLPLMANKVVCVCTLSVINLG